MQAMISNERAKLNIAENLCRLMELCELSQLELAARAKISQPFVHKMVKGKVLPNAVALRNVAEVLGVSTDSLLDDPPAEKTKKTA
jgi:transcriptional regulator with XRE-family HTH domain